MPGDKRAISPSRIVKDARRYSNRFLEVLVSKVFHANDETHARVREFCEKHGLRSKDWVDRIVTWALNKKIIDPEPNKQPVYTEAKKKLEPPPPATKDAPKPWEQKPFWENRAEQKLKAIKDLDEKGPAHDASQREERPAEETDQSRPATIPGAGD
jgi:type IV secretory pathway VirB10-like protein